MGQAKRRGSFEERKAQSIERSRAEAAARLEAYKKTAPMPQARSRRRMSPVLAAAVIAAAAWPR